MSPADRIRIARRIVEARADEAGIANAQGIAVVSPDGSVTVDIAATVSAADIGEQYREEARAIREALESALTPEELANIVYAATGGKLDAAGERGLDKLIAATGGGR